MKTTSARAAAEIRKELKEKFPSIKFSVTSDNFSMGDAVTIKYTDGVQSDKIRAITNKYQYGHFDSMTDMYENSNRNDTIPQAKYVQVERRMSEETNNLLRKEFDLNGSEWDGNNLVGREFCQRSF